MQSSSGVNGVGVGLSEVTDELLLQTESDKIAMNTADIASRFFIGQQFYAARSNSAIVQT